MEEMHPKTFFVLVHLKRGKLEKNENSLQLNFSSSTFDIEGVAAILCLTGNAVRNQRGHQDNPAVRMRLTWKSRPVSEFDVFFGVSGCGWQMLSQVFRICNNVTALEIREKYN